MRTNKASLPIATLTIFGITAATTALQFPFPQLIQTFGRVPGALAAHQYWRLLTPIFFHPEGWKQIVFDFSALVIVGAIAEQIVKTSGWLVLYFSAAFVGEVAGLLWQPTGAGSSVAICGLLGFLARFLMRRESPRQAHVGGWLIVVGALILSAMRDIHGPPMLIGVLLAPFIKLER